MTTTPLTLLELSASTEPRADGTGSTVFLEGDLLQDAQHVAHYLVAWTPQYALPLDVLLFLHPSVAPPGGLGVCFEVRREHAAAVAVEFQDPAVMMGTPTEEGMLSPDEAREHPACNLFLAYVTAIVEQDTRVTAALGTMAREETT